MDNSSNPLATPIKLRSGLVMRNRLVKAALAEHLAKKGQPEERLSKLYKEWGNGGWGAVITGNVMIDPQYLGDPGDTTISLYNSPALPAWKSIASNIKTHGSLAIMQINHPGRQSPIGAGNRSIFTKNLAPSAIALDFGSGIFSSMLVKMIWGTPAEMSIAQIEGIVEKFVDAARVARDAGFDGVEIHAAHGYLLSDFLSAKANRRTDEWGGSPAKRAAIVARIIREIRKAVGEAFVIGVKMNSADQQNEVGFEAVMEQVSLLAAEEIDFLEISGGTYEDPQMINGNSTPAQKSERTAKREAFFLDFALSVRTKHPDLVLMLTGGFRTRSGMNSALKDRACDIIGIGRPSVIRPDFPKRFLGVADEKADGDVKEEGDGLVLNKVKEPWFLAWVPQRPLRAALRGGLESQYYCDVMRKSVE